jgi:hypothetical protein
MFKLAGFVRVAAISCVGALLLWISGCASTTKFNKAEINQIKKVAVVVFTVPETIEYKEDPKAVNSGGGLMQLVKAVVKATSQGNGPEAAQLSLVNFIDTANSASLPFKILSYDEMGNNAEFTALIKPPEVEVQKNDATSMLMSAMAPKKEKGVPPPKLNGFGLDPTWDDGNALTGANGEMEYIVNAIKALKVDAALVINDRGYSFSCSACIGQGGVMSGTGSTGSAFNATMVTGDGKVILDLREWFGSTSANTPVVANVVNPFDHKRLFEAHGVKMANLFSNMFSEKLAAK